MSADRRIALFYPIAPNAVWVERFAAGGAHTIQLRVKDQSAAVVRSEVQNSLSLARNYGTQLVVNDYWQIALDEGAEYIHLGQEDLAAADLKAIRRKGVRVGVSTHDEAELETALCADADYIALGPIYETKLKVMRFAPQGLGRLRTWRERIGKTPLIGIGGITLELASDIIAAGADSVAVVTDVVSHADPDVRIAQWTEWAARRTLLNIHG